MKCTNLNCLTQNCEESWQDRFDSKYNHDDPNGVALCIYEDDTQRPAQDEIKAFITQELEAQRNMIVDVLKDMKKLPVHPHRSIDPDFKELIEVSKYEKEQETLDQAINLIKNL